MDVPGTPCEGLLPKAERGPGSSPCSPLRSHSSSYTHLERLWCSSASAGSSISCTSRPCRPFHSRIPPAAALSRRSRRRVALVVVVVAVARTIVVTLSAGWAVVGTTLASNVAVSSCQLFPPEIELLLLSLRGCKNTVALVGLEDVVFVFSLRIPRKAIPASPFLPSVCPAATRLGLVSLPPAMRPYSGRAGRLRSSAMERAVLGRRGVVDWPLGTKFSLIFLLPPPGGSLHHALTCKGGITVRCRIRWVSSCVSCVYMT